MSCFTQTLPFCHLPCLFVTSGHEAIKVLIALMCALCFENIDFCVELFVYRIYVLFPGFALLLQSKILFLSNLIALCGFRLVLW